ncbi:MAG TPA: hypothetical protein VMW28_00480 [Pelolinea sp.]|nr:hypothetical protein [Pelolinea sp.]
MKNKVRWMSLLIAALMLVTAITPVFADTETDPAGEPAPVEETSGFWNHPIVKLLASFFSGLFETPAVEEPVEEEGTEGEEPLPPVVPEEVVAALHEEQKLGFGEMTKLFQIVAEAKAACVLEGVNCDVTLEGLVAEYKDGAGMGALFKEYGKPSLLGVGQVRKELNPKEKSNNGKAKGKNK